MPNINTTALKVRCRHHGRGWNIDPWVNGASLTTFVSKTAILTIAGWFITLALNTLPSFLGHGSQAWGYEVPISGAGSNLISAEALLVAQAQGTTMEAQKL